MEYIYIDESGTMTQEHSDTMPYQVIALVRVHNISRMKIVIKRFVADNFKHLKEIDHEHKMFRGDSFYELKGSALDHATKDKLIRFLCRNNYFEVFYIKIVNSRIRSNLYSNKARATNYIVGLALDYFFKNGYLPYDDYHLQIDEQNIKTESQNVLEEYLNMKLAMEKGYAKGFHVEYFDSSRNKLVQLADVFANLYYSEILQNNYTELIDQLRKDGYIKHEFIFPLGTIDNNHGIYYTKDATVSPAHSPSSR